MNGVKEGATGRTRRKSCQEEGAAFASTEEEGVF